MSSYNKDNCQRRAYKVYMVSPFESKALTSSDLCFRSNFESDSTKNTLRNTSAVMAVLAAAEKDEFHGCKERIDKPETAAFIHHPV